jgi:hypothetical protein
MKSTSESHWKDYNFYKAYNDNITGVPERMGPLVFLRFCIYYSYNESSYYYQKIALEILYKIVYDLSQKQFEIYLKKDENERRTRSCKM